MVYSESMKFEIDDELQSRIDALAAHGVSLRQAERRMQVKSSTNADTKPVRVSVLHVVAFPVARNRTIWRHRRPPASASRRQSLFCSSGTGSHH